MADPQLSFNFAQETQTELSLLPVNMIDTDTNTERQETQTVDRNSVIINTTINTEEASTSTETVCVNKHRSKPRQRPRRTFAVLK